MRVQGGGGFKTQVLTSRHPHCRVRHDIALHRTAARRPPASPCPPAPPPQVNVSALRMVPAQQELDTLAHQLLHLRLGLDALEQQVQIDGAGEAGPPTNLMALLAAKQRLRGRDRHVAIALLEPPQQQQQQAAAGHAQA